MLKHAVAHERGRQGEDAAVVFLEQLGGTILERNWRSGHLEVDIICILEDFLVFVEVKARAKNSMIRPDEALTSAKKAKLVRAAQSYLTEHDAWRFPCRFDLVCVRCDCETCEVEHFPHAFELTDIMGSGNAAWQPW